MDTNVHVLFISLLLSLTIVAFIHIELIRRYGLHAIYSLVLTTIVSVLSGTYIIYNIYNILGLLWA